MGIERFFNSISKNTITNLNNPFTNKLQNQITCDHICIDFNSIIYITSNQVISDINKLIYYKITNKITPKITQTAILYNINLSKDIQQQINIDDIILQKTKDYTINIIQNYVNPTKLQTIFIAVDGVPDKAKMIEQKHRRYMGTVISELKKQLFKKYEKELKQHPSRYEYEKNKISWKRNNISPGTTFMNKLDTILTKLDIKSYCPKLQSYTYSKSTDPGEGETKLMNHIRSQKNIKNVVIYSPDNDLTPLGLLLYVPNVIILKHNQQDNNYDVIHLDKLSDNLYNYITSKTNKKLDQQHIIDDIVFILSIFGNDFIPKIQTINVKNDFTIIIDTYIAFINTHSYIIQNKKINQKNFLQILKLLSQDEDKNISKNYMSSNYENYEKLKKIMNATDATFTKQLNDFLAKYNTFTNIIRSGKKYDIDNAFIITLMKLTKINDKYYDNATHFMSDYIHYYKSNNKLPQIKLSFIPYQRTINSMYYKKKLERIHDSIDPHLTILEYDIENFKLDYLLDEYQKKLHVYPINLGYVTIKNNTFISENIDTSIQKYYATFFGPNPNLNDISEKYIEGLLWVFKYYYFKTDLNNANVWFYEYHLAPLLKQIYTFLEKQSDTYIDKLYTNLRKYEVPRRIFFTPEEHLLYVSPSKYIKDILPKKYHNIVFDKSLFPDIDPIIDEIMKNNVSNDVDCRGALFLNKCDLKILKKESWDNFDKLFLKKVRSV